MKKFLIVCLIFFSAFVGYSISFIKYRYTIKSQNFLSVYSDGIYWKVDGCKVYEIYDSKRGITFYQILTESQIDEIRIPVGIPVVTK